MGSAFSNRPVFQGVVHLKPSRKVLFPKWDLHMVLQFLDSAAFHLSNNPCKWYLTLNTSILVVITSASRVLEIAALRTKEPFIMFFDERVVWY